MRLRLAALLCCLAAAPSAGSETFEPTLLERPEILVDGRSRPDLDQALLHLEVTTLESGEISIEVTLVNFAASASDVIAPGDITFGNSLAVVFSDSPISYEAPIQALRSVVDSSDSYNPGDVNVLAPDSLELERRSVGDFALRGETSSTSVLVPNGLMTFPQLGPWFNEEWRVSEVTHVFSQEIGYRTLFRSRAPVRPIDMSMAPRGPAFPILR